MQVRLLSGLQSRFEAIVFAFYFCILHFICIHGIQFDKDFISFLLC